MGMLVYKKLWAVFNTAHLFLTTDAMCWPEYKKCAHFSALFSSFFKLLILFFDRSKKYLINEIVISL
jgi:hypothetical protein